MSRRVPVAEAAGAHRPETVAGRLAEDLTHTVAHLSQLGGHMPSLDDTLARLDAVVAAATQFKKAAEDDVAVKVEERVAALEAVLGLSPDPQVDPAV